MLLETRNNHSAAALTFSFFVVAASVSVGRTGSPLVLAFALPLLVFLSNKAPHIFPLGLYAFFLPFDSVLVAGSGATYTKYLGILCIAVLIFKGLAEGRLKSPSGAVLWWAGYILWAIFSVIWAIDFDVPVYLERAGTAMGLLMLYLAVSSYPLEEKEYEAFKKFVLYGGLAAAAYAAYASGFQAGPGPEGIERATLSSGEMTTDPNQFAFSLLVPFGICLHLMLEAKKRLKWFFYAAALAVLAYAIVITESRGGAVGMAIISAVLLYHSRKRRVVLAVLVFAAVLVFLAPENYYHRLTTESYERGGAGRLDIWKVGLEAFRHNWLLGVGLDNFPIAYDYYNYAAPGAKFEGYTRAAHNIFLAGAVEFGMVGAFVMIFGIIAHYRLVGRSKKISQDHVLLRACLLGAFAHAMTLDVIWRKSFWLLWMLIVMHDLAVSGRIKDEPDSPVAHVPL